LVAWLVGVDFVGILRPECRDLEPRPRGETGFTTFFANCSKVRRRIVPKKPMAR